MDIEMSSTVTHESWNEPFLLPPITSMNHVEGTSSVQYIEQSVGVDSVNHDIQDTFIQIDNYDYRLINALDLGLMPIDDEDHSKLNKSMDVSTIHLLFEQLWVNYQK